MRNEDKVYEVALMCVGGVENSIYDGDWESDTTPTEQELYDMAMVDVRHECPREVRFLGNAEIARIVGRAVAAFEFPFGARTIECEW